ncbi:helicase SNF [Bacillus toyonensis]|uniref:helicase-related protein n=1 Tax=Bacillus toyonensis TaxID=155322 RepID=UPI000BFB3B1E|nr:DEAD/DEAH box helicase [Bacillus toyonensis]PHE64377.1 helicase SNF [Bacillus toyonensis]
MAKREVKYYNDRLQGSISEENCRILEYIIGKKQRNESIDDLKRTIYDLSKEEVEQIRQTGVVDPSISREKGTLRDAQTLGVAFMTYAGNCILGDSVGLGKTVQIASLINLGRKQNHDNGLPFRYLFLTEKTLVDQAVSKLTQFTRQYVHELSGEKKANDKWRKEKWEGHNGGIVAPHSLVNQQIFHSWLDDMLDDMDIAQGFTYFDYLFIDEGSIFGNTKTQTYKFAEALKKYCKNIIIMNATPFEKKLDVFYAQLNFLNKSLMPTMTEFKRTYYVYDYNGQTRYGVHNGKYKNAERFRHQVGYHYFFHTRKELGAQMINTHYELMSRPMSKEQEELMKWTNMYGYVYDCPTILDPNIPFDETAVPKLEMLDEILDSKVKGGQQVLIFCHYKEAQRHLQEWLENLGYSTEILNGDITNRDERDEIVQAFVDKEYDILVTSVQKGLDFGEVENLVFYSFSSNPNKMIQMEGRITRSFNIENKNFFILANEGRELNKLRKEVKKTMGSSMDFSSSDLSAVVELLLNIME